MGPQGGTDSDPTSASWNNRQETERRGELAVFIRNLQFVVFSLEAQS